MRNLLTRHTLWLLLLACAGGALAPVPLCAQPAAARDAAETALSLKRLGVAGSVLYIAAHPDDENTALLAYLANERGVRTGYLSLTRGDGGQNLLGSEKGELLGLVRTEELLAARRIDGAEQFFTRAIDFGYTKSPAETLRIWGHEEVLADVVWVIRRFRPDVIITRFPTTGEGGHGQHTASAILAGEAFEAAADPARFPEQLRAGVSVWRARRLLWNSFGARPGERPANAEQLVSLDLGAYNALLGKSYTELAAASRSMHKSQGFGSPERRGTAINYFTTLAGERPTRDILDGVDLTWNRVPGGAAVGETLAEAARRFDPSAPALVLPLLLRAHAQMSKLADDDPLVSTRRRELLDVIRACAGLWLEAIATEPEVTPGAEARLNVTLVNRSDFPLRLERIDLPDGNAPREVHAELKNNQPLSTQLSVRVSADAEPSQPYWLREEHGPGLFTVSDRRLVGTPESEPALPVRVALAAGEAAEPLVFTLPALFRRIDPVRGEVYRPVSIVPAVTLNLEEGVRIFPDGQPREVRLTLRQHAPGTLDGTLRLRLPAGWRAEPASLPLTLRGQGEERTAVFNVTPSAAPSTATLAAEFESGGRTLTRSLVRIDYPHIPAQTLLPEARARLVRLDLQKRGAEIGYVMGSGDEIPEALRQVGYRVTLLTDEDLAAADLRKFDAIITGVRAYNTRPRLRARAARLLDYVAAGGTLVVQYNTPDPALEGVPLGPYPFKLSQERVTVEEAPVTLVAPDDALLNTPNKITASDFAGWVQERGLYFANEWDARYQTLLESHDPGESEKRGSTLVARVGRGTYVYTSLAFFRQLPAGVPGAYRLFVNLISAGRDR